MPLMCSLDRHTPQLISSDIILPGTRLISSHPAPRPFKIYSAPLTPTLQLVAEVRKLESRPNPIDKNYGHRHRRAPNQTGVVRWSHLGSLDRAHCRQRNSHPSHWSESVASVRAPNDAGIGRYFHSYLNRANSGARLRRFLPGNVGW